MISERNKTIFITKELRQKFSKNIITFEKKQKIKIDDFLNKTINGDGIVFLQQMPENSIDLIVTDPPYNLTKKYSTSVFNRKTDEKYSQWLEQWVKECFRILKENGSMYVCCDWKSSIILYEKLRKYFNVQNRITWSRDKGRASYKNWKNNIEDIYFVTKHAKKYTFNFKKIQILKKVIAPYVNKDKEPKDWFILDKTKYRLTSHPNIWTDITIPFWSMKENTVHPTQKPEKVIAKLILASSNEGDIVLDPFLGSGTTSVVAKKLNRKYIGIEIEKDYVYLAEKRIQMTEKDKKIQGYDGHCFLDKLNN